MTKEIQDVVATVIRTLVYKNYEDLASLTRGRRLSSEEIGKAIKDYGRTLVEPPPDAYNLIQVVPVRAATTETWSITMPLWTEEEGRSDLSLLLTLKRTGERFRIELDDIRVL